MQHIRSLRGALKIFKIQNSKSKFSKNKIFNTPGAAYPEFKRSSQPRISFLRHHSIHCSWRQGKSNQMSFVKKPLANTILAVLSNLALKVNKSCSWGALFSLPLKRAESKVWGLPISLYIISGFRVCLSRIQYDCNVVFANRGSPKIFWEGHITPKVFCACLFDAGVCSAATQLTIILELALFWYPRNVGYWKCTQRQRPLPFRRFMNTSSCLLCHKNNVAVGQSVQDISNSNSNNKRFVLCSNVTVNEFHRTFNAGWTSFWQTDCRLELSLCSFAPSLSAHFDTLQKKRDELW